LTSSALLSVCDATLDTNRARFSHESVELDFSSDP
jgi:hypothetical protein